MRFEQCEELLHMRDRSLGVVGHGGCGLDMDTACKIGKYLLRQQNGLRDAISDGHVNSNGK